MCQLPICINGSSVSVVTAASGLCVSMCACKSSIHDTHKSVVWSRCAIGEKVLVEKLGFA